MPAGSVWAAPVGTKPGADGWKLIGHTVDGVTMTEPFTSSEHQMQVKWPEECLRPYLNTIDKAVANMAAAEFGGYRQRFMAGSLPVELNERSKPMGLKEAARYEDADGRKLVVGYSEYAKTDKTWIRTPDSCGAHVKDADIIPVALNVLGYDRLTVNDRRYPGDAQSHGPLVVSDSQRDRLVTEAAGILRAVDLHDQRKAVAKAAAEKLVVEHAARVEAAAKAARAEVAKREIAERFLRKVKDTYADAIRDQIALGINAESAAKVQAALSAYETARRKVEGLPN